MTTLAALLAFAIIWLPVAALLWLCRGREKRRLPPMKRPEYLAYAGAVTHGSGR